jgi:hypothetical protein
MNEMTLHRAGETVANQRFCFSKAHHIGEAKEMGITEMQFPGKVAPLFAAYQAPISMSS